MMFQFRMIIRNSIGSRYLEIINFISHCQAPCMRFLGLISQGRVHET